MSTLQGIFIKNTFIPFDKLLRITTNEKTIHVVIIITSKDNYTYEIERESIDGRAIMQWLGGQLDLFLGRH